MCWVRDDAGILARSTNADNQTILWLPEFLRSKKHLRREDLRIPGSQNDSSVNHRSSSAFILKTALRKRKRAAGRRIRDCSKASRTGLDKNSMDEVSHCDKLSSSSFCRRFLWTHLIDMMVSQVRIGFHASCGCKAYQSRCSISIGEVVVHLFWSILIGIAAGWLGGKIMKGRGLWAAGRPVRWNRRCGDWRCAVRRNRIACRRHSGKSHHGDGRRGGADLCGSRRQESQTVNIGQ